jgi:hypothetical protein
MSIVFQISLRSKGSIFSSAAGEPTAIMNIDGRDIRLRQIDNTQAHKDWVVVLSYPFSDTLTLRGSG